MNKKLYFSLLFVSLFFYSAVAGVVTHKIKKGESVSFICLKTYGFYNDSLGSEILKINPKLKTLSLVYPGYNLKLKIAEKKMEKKSIEASGGVATFVAGEALFVRDGKKKPLAVNTELLAGDKIITMDNGKVELIINCETVCRIGGNTEVLIKAFRKSAPDVDKSEIALLAGTVWTKMKKFKDRVTRFQISMPNAVAGVHGTVYESSTSSDTSSDVRVFSGEVAVSNAESNPGTLKAPHEIAGPHEVSMQEWSCIVRKMQQVHIGKVKSSDPENFEVKKPTAWEDWNFARDGQVKSIFGE